MTDNSRQQEDRSSVMNGPPSSNPQLQAGLIPHFAMASDSSMGLTAHHSLAAYGIMHHQPIGMGRVPSNPPNDMGPPIFMPSLNLGVPRVATTTMNQATKQNSLNQPFMQDVPMGFPPQSLIFHPSPVRQSSQPPYLSPSSPVNIKLATSKSGTTKPMATKTQVVRPTPKQPTSTSLNTKLTNVAVSRPKGESPINHVTYAPGLYMLSTVSQKGSSTLSKMLMSPAHQQTSVASSAQQKGSMDVGGAFVQDTTAVPTSSSIGDGKGAALSDGYPGRLSDHVTTSGQSTSMTSFTDTKNERPPQPSAAYSPSSQPLPQVGLANKDKSNIIIKKGSSLTGRHIAAITNNNTLQPTSVGSMQPAYTQGSVPQTVDSVKTEYDPADTGWQHLPPEHAIMATENQTIGNQGTGKTLGGMSVPTVMAPGVLDISTVTHSPGGGNLPGSPVRPSGLLHPQGVGTSPRPQILRKRTLDSSLSQGEFPLVPLSPTSDGGVAPLNHVGGRSDPGDVSASPRKKPRKQNMVANDDMYASNVPDSLSSSSASSLDTPLSVEGSEESGRTSGSSKSTRSKKESIKDGAPMEVEIRYLSQLRRSPYPISSLHKVCHKAPHNHFKQHSDIKRKDESRLSAVELASDRYALQRAEGWRVHHVLKQVKEMSSVEQELLEVAESLRSFSDDMKASKKCVIETEYLDNFKELVECNSVRSSRILSHMESTRAKSLQLLEHRPQVTELLVKCSPPSPLLPHLFTNHHTTS